MPTLPPTSSVTRSPSAPPTAKLDDSNPPNCTDQSDIDGIIVFSGGADDGETGIATVSLIAGAQNLNLTVNPFTIGDQTVSFLILYYLQTFGQRYQTDCIVFVIPP